MIIAVYRKLSPSRTSSSADLEILALSMEFTIIIRKLFDFQFLFRHECYAGIAELLEFAVILLLK